VTLKQLTGYPWQGDSKITVEPKRPAEFAVYIRIPGWARNKPVPSDLYKYMKDSDEKVALKVNGESVAVDMERGFARIRRNWKKGDVIELNLPMPIRRVLCKKKVKDNLRKGALERGPIVYCAEETDNGPGVHRLVISADVRLKPQYREDLFGGVSVLKGRIRTWHREQAYVYPDKQDFIAIPYYAWAHRSPGEMVVWLPRFIGFPEAGAQ
ncbi:MAG: glycoside hydrolase family 127 protein, partial [Planctomycetota bacterium]|jgi:DUF1680 family protein